MQKFSSPRARAGRLVVTLSIGLMCLASPSFGQPRTEPPARSWTEEKCARYTKGWSDLIARRGTADLGEAFLARHEAFLASGCLARGDVCPRSPAEFDVANILTILAMNAGTASTFLPFSCRR